VSRRTLWYVVIAVGVAGCLLLLFALLAKFNAQADDNHQLLLSSRAATRAAEANTAQIQDCLDKGGDCYKAARKQHEADRWTQILAAACAARYAGMSADDRIARTFACVSAHVHGFTQLGDPPRRGP
jgi:Tfp pilus assembly protein PilV